MKKKKVRAYYTTDLVNNDADFDQEISIWMNYWASEPKKKIKSLSQTLKYISNNNLKTMFPNTKELMNIWPIASATC